MGDMKHKQFFLQRFEMLIECFPSLKSKSKIDRIYYFMKDVNEIGIAEIFETIIDNFKYAPTPNDFHEAVVAWNKKNKVNSFNADDLSPILCRSCGDLGIVRIQHHHDPDFDCLMSCDCKVSITKTLKAPIWDNGLLAAYIKTSCPLEWFKPVSIDTFDKNNSEIKTIIKNWNARKTKAEKYWFDMGYRH